MTPCLVCGNLVYSFPSRIRKFCSFSCRSTGYRGDGNPKWRGGKSIDKSGYVYIYAPWHPYANKDGNVMEHRLVMESMIGRHLEPQEVVHHINRIEGDNRPENLQLFANNGEHKKAHSHGLVEVQCQGCGKTFTASAAEHRRKPRMFCGSKCTSSYASRCFWSRRGEVAS